MSSTRITRDEYFLQIAELTAKRSTCDRAQVGAVAVKDKRIVMSGYNGSPAGMNHCDEGGHYLINGHCEATIHAEQNIIAQAAKNGVSLNESTIYVTHEPCFHCMKLLIGSGVKRVVFRWNKTDNRIPLAYHNFIKVEQLFMQEYPCSFKDEVTKNHCWNCGEKFNLIAPPPYKYVFGSYSITCPRCDKVNDFKVGDKNEK